MREVVKSCAAHPKEAVMNFETIAGLALSVAALIYLLYALLRGEKL